jgi:hypothetical protein
MKKITLILTLLVFATIGGKGQNTEAQLDSLATKFVRDLKDAGITKIGYAKNYCIGYYYTWDNENDRCDYETIYYSLHLFWQVENQTFVKKFDNCGEFNQIQIANSDFLDFYFDNQEKINAEKVKNFQAIVIKENGDTLIWTSKVNHSCHWTLVIHDHDQSVIKSINENDLLEEPEFGSKHLNINYEFNRDLKTVEWMRLTESQINRVTKNKKFERNK